MTLAPLIALGGINCLPVVITGYSIADSTQLNSISGMNDDVLSPCINICIIDERSGYCAGCQRTLDEIAGWFDLTDDAKREIMVRVEARRRDAARKYEGQ